jgi:hypothetical protein
VTEEAETQKPKNKRGCGFWIIVAMGGLIGLAALGSILPEPTQEEKIAAAAERIAKQEAEMAEAASKRASAIKVTASQLFEAYQANEMAAQQSYGGRTIEVTGQIDGVDLDISDNPVIKLRTSNQFMPVSIYLIDDRKSAAAAYNKGEKASFLCEDVSEVISMPQVKECVPVK